MNDKRETGSGATGRIHRATRADVGRAAGVSPAVASVVLNGAAGNIRVSEATRRRVLAAAERLGYRANPVARAMARGRSRNLALVLGDVASNSILPPARLAALLAAMERRGVHMVLARLPDERLCDEAAVRRLLADLTADALVMIYNYAVPEAFEQLAARHLVPVVWLNRKAPQDCVYPDETAAGRACARRLAAEGWPALRFIGGVRGAREHYSMRDRRNGCLAAARRAGLPAAWSECGAWNGRTMRVEETVPDAGGRIAYVCYRQDMMTAVARLEQSRGRRLGVDYTMATFDDEPAPWPFDDCPVVRFDEATLAERAVEMALAKTEDPATALPSVAVPPLPLPIPAPRN